MKRRKALPSRGTTARAAVVRELDHFFSLYIRGRDRRCVICGTTENLTCGHLLTRSSYGTRWDEMNAFCQCSGCNLTHEYHPERLTLHFLKVHGQRAYEALVYRHSKPTKYSTAELRLMMGEWVARCAALEEARA